MHRAARTSALVFGASLAFATLGQAAEPERRCEHPASRPSLTGCAETARHARLKLVDTREKKRLSRRNDLKAAKPTIDGDQFRPRAPALAQRSKKLLIAEIRSLESLLKRTHPKSPDRALLLRRIADDYAELAAISERERIVAEIESESATVTKQRRRNRDTGARTR